MDIDLEKTENNRQMGFNYEDLEPETRAFVQERALLIYRLARRVAEDIRQIGRYLTEVKERVGHGKFLEWIDCEFAWSERTARNFMMVYERFKTANFADLDIDVSGLYLIAAPKTPEPVRDELIQRAEQGATITRADVLEAMDVYFEQHPTLAQEEAERRIRKAQEKAERRALKAEEQTERVLRERREAQERAEQILREEQETKDRLLRERREAEQQRKNAEERVEVLLRERDEVQLSRYMSFRKLIEAVRYLAEFHMESVPLIWEGIVDARGGEEFMEDLDRAQRCLSRMRMEHPNAVRKPGVVLQKPS